MKSTFLTLAVAAQFLAVGAFAQTADTTTTGTADMGAMSGSYGSDWSTTLGPAMFGDDGMTLRADADIATQWGTLSEDDKAMIRRDCAMQMQKSAGTTGTTEGSTTTDTAATDTTGGAAATDSTAMGMMAVSGEQMDTICAATKDL